MDGLGSESLVDFMLIPCRITSNLEPRIYAVPPEEIRPTFHRGQMFANGFVLITIKGSKI